MSEMVERVARAIWDITSEPALKKWDELDQWAKDHSEAYEQARAAIAALREPTEGMLRVGYESEDDCCSAVEIWGHMLDEALK